ncbi:hypothetical protein GDO86_003153 [Hymenochirus boettgeri]|uniref:Serpin domain-containing protein n=1 Tax=Hymenochirus boettgeri TaxID=247094 RepID=A0A8T2K8E1_9PIPI|nr:hypothetical protein GDO86_003153 [Hymenochirus boettgeri]KAG8450777.1 hypothetical protein GDO86_003153 [Hymenochirus boettgeri]
MDRAVLVYLLALSGIFYVSAEIEDAHNVTEHNEESSTPTTRPMESTHAVIVNSTSDTWNDLGKTTQLPTPTTSGLDDDLHNVPDNQSETESKEKSSSEVNSVQTTVGEGDDGESCDENVSQEEIKKISQALTSFSIDLLRDIDPNSQKPSVVISPYSIALGLFQLSLGAGKDTQLKIMETLHIEPSDCLHNQIKFVTNELTKSLLRVATRIYFKKGFNVKESFLERSEKWYGSKPLNLAANKEENLESINDWVKEVTEGKIPHFLSDLPSNVMLMLLNAMHFKGIWKNKFNSSLTYQDLFYINDELTVPVEMMNAQKYPLSWFHLENIDSHVARLQFKGNMSFIVIMPSHSSWNMSTILAHVNHTDLCSRFPKEKPTNLRMPKFSLDYRLELSQALSNLGLGQLFTDPDLKKISDEPLFVSSIEHEATLELNEEGVEASAVTSIITSRSHSIYSVNRPFVFFLYDDTTGIPLFAGHVRNPNPDFQQKIDGFNEPQAFNKGSIPK